jgi:hypothetical protein
MVSRKHSRSTGTQHGKEHGMIVEEPSAVSHQPSGKTLYERLRPAWIKLSRSTIVSVQLYPSILCKKGFPDG